MTNQELLEMELDTCDDLYGFIIWNYGLNRKPNPINRLKIDKLLAEAGVTLEEACDAYRALQGDDWERFQIFADIKCGHYQTPQELGEEIGLSGATINKRLNALGIPKYNGNESNPYGKRYIPNAIKGRLVELILEF